MFWVVNFPTSSMNRPTPTPDTTSVYVYANLFAYMMGIRLLMYRRTPPYKTWAMWRVSFPSWG